MRSLLLILFLALASCTSRPDLTKVALWNLNEDTIRITPADQHLTVIYFLSPECPLCINYTLAMRNLEEDFSSEEVKFYGIFAQEWFSATEVRNFALKYDLEFEMLLDDGNQLAAALGATVTPEVFILNQRSEIVYSGKIDNWVNELGKKKLEVSDHYLRNALANWREGKSVDPKRTEPVGCLIE